MLEERRLAWVARGTDRPKKRPDPWGGRDFEVRTGHAINLEEPERFNQTLDDFFAAVEEGRWHTTPDDSRSVY